MASSDFPERPGITWEVGTRLEAQDVTSKWYRAKIVEIRETQRQVMVHFDGWNSRWDDWFPMESERLRPCTKIADWRDKKREKKSPLKVNQRVLARWKTFSMYPARIAAVNGDGTYRVVFHDGYEQNVTANNIKSATADELNRIEKEIESRQWLAPQVAEGRRPRKPIKPDESFIITEPIVRRRSSDKGETSGHERTPSGEKKPKVGVASPASILRRLKKNRKYLKLGEALPEDSARALIKQSSGESSAAQALEENYDSFKASVVAKRRRTASQHSSGRTTPTGETDQSAIEDADQSGESPRKIKVKTALHAKMARVREVCNKWKKDKNKKVGKKHLSSLGLDEVVMDEVQNDDLLTKPSRTPPIVVTSTPLLVSVDADISTLESASSPLGPRAKQELELGEKPIPSASDKSHDPTSGEIPTTPATPMTPSTPSASDGGLDKRNKYPCPHCPRSFRKENLLNYHLKYYHSEETAAPLESVVPADELAIARKKPNPIKREDRKRSREDGAERGSSKRKSEDSYRPGIAVLDPKRSSTGLSVDADLDSPANQPDLSSSSNFLLDHSSSEIKQERGDSFPNVEENVVSDSEISIKTERERYDSFGVDSIVSEDQESVVGEERQEVINCPCGFSEENGLMIQCEVCFCWQHVVCIRLSEDKLPVKYICWVCTNPPGVRDSMRHIHDQDWLKEGQLTRFSYLARTRESMRRVPMLKTLAALIGDVLNINGVLTAMKKMAVVAVKGANSELDSVYASLEAALAHGTVPPLPDRGLSDGNSDEEFELGMHGQDFSDGVDIAARNTGTTDQPAEQQNNQSVSADETHEIPQVASNSEIVDSEPSNSGTGEVPKENGDLVCVGSGTNGVSMENESCGPINGPSALSDHSYLQTGDRRNVVAYRYARSGNQRTQWRGRDESVTGSGAMNEAQRNICLYVSAHQDLIDERLDRLEQEAACLEDQDAGQALTVDADPLVDISSVKKSLRRMLNDLQKVKRMATYSMNRR